VAHHKSALKRIRSSERKRIRNRLVKVRVRTFVKKARAQLSAAQPDAATSREAVLAAIKELDKAATKGVIHRNNAARRKSRLMKQLNKLQA
jgi:small subunit ribosomal protein S20